MNRRAFLGGLSAFSVAGFGLYAQSTEQRVDDLEAQVADLDRRVTALEAQGAGEGIDPIRTGEESTDGNASVSLEGSGTSVTRKFTLTAQRYRVDAQLRLSEDFSGFAALLHGPSGSQDLLFNELIEGRGSWDGSTTVDVDEAGQYFVEVTNTTASWELKITAF
jgi:hypothetical protein